MKKIRFLKNLYKKLGPGFITGAADDDPSGIATYAQTGAQFGYGQLWTALFSLPFMTVIQEMCGRIGIVTGNGLAGVVRAHYRRSVLFFAVGLLLVANTINIGADLGAMAATVQLLVPAVSFVVLLLAFTILTLMLEILVSYPRYAKFLKYLTLSLLAYIVSVLLMKQDWHALLRATVLPHIAVTKTYLLNIVAILGTTIAPYLFFWQADEEVEEEISAGQIKEFGTAATNVSRKQIKNLRVDTFIGMFFSNLIMFFIIAATASTLYVHGASSIDTAAQAAQSLRPFAGEFAFALFALGIVGTGLLAVPILAGSAAYAISETIGWKAGLFLKFKQAHGFYGVITIATIVGLLVNFLHIPPFKVLYYTSVLNGFAAPPLMILILAICNNKKIMGGYTNSSFSNIMGVFMIAVMILSAGALVVSAFV